MAKEACRALDKLDVLKIKDPFCVTKAINSAADQRKHAIAAAIPK
jgi:hypothetical protein